MKYIYHHLGLGDHIICNGLVRHFKEIYGCVTVFCKPNNYENVKYMYRDDENIVVMPIGEDSDIINYILSNNIREHTIVAGFNQKGTETAKTFDEAFYNTSNIPFDYRFSKFKFVRDLDKEEQVYKELNPKDEPYIYLHDDKSRGFSIDIKKVRGDIKIIENDKRFLMFDMLKIVENAEEVHTMATGMKDLINSFNFKYPDFYLHWYVRRYEDYLDSVGVNKFNKII